MPPLLYHSTVAILPCLRWFWCCFHLLIIFSFIFINLGLLAVRQAAAMPLPLMHLCCCISPLAAWQHLLPIPMSLPQRHDAFFTNQSPGRCFLLGVMVVGVVAWCCCCLVAVASCLGRFAIVISIPISDTLPAIAIIVSVHCHYRRRPLPSLPPSPSTVAIAMDSCYRHHSCYRCRQLLSPLTVAITVDHCHHYRPPTVAICITTSSLSHSLLELVVYEFVFIVVIVHLCHHQACSWCFCCCAAPCRSLLNSR